MRKIYTLMALAVLMLVTSSVSAQNSFSLCSETPWGAWQAKSSGSSISFGTCDVNIIAKSDTYRLFLGDIDSTAVTFTIADSQTFGIKVGAVNDANDGNGRYEDIVFTANTSSDEGTKTSAITIKADTFELQYTLEVTVKNLTATTLQQFKELTAGLPYGTAAKYAGSARVEWQEGPRAWLSDGSGSIMLEGRRTTFNDSIKPGAMVCFSGKAMRPGNPNYYAWSCTEIHALTDSMPNWTYPQRQEVSSPLTENDYGKVVDLKNLKYKGQEVSVSMFGPGEGGYYPIYITFIDNDSNEYIVNPLNVSNRYVWGLESTGQLADKFAMQDQAYKDLCDTLRNGEVEIVGAVFGGSKSNGAPEPFISPIWIRPMKPIKTLASGTYEMTAKSYIYEEDTYWDVTVTQDESNPYLYKFTHLVEGDGGRDFDVYGELDDACDSLKIYSGQKLEDYSFYDIYLATAATFDRTGNTPEQEPLPKGTYIKCTVDSTNQITINDIFDYCNYIHEWSDPESIYHNLRWNHYGIWYAGATMKLKQETPDAINVVAADSDGKAEIKDIYDLQGRHISSLQKGINIVRMSNGTTRKVIIK